MKEDPIIKNNDYTGGYCSFFSFEDYRFYASLAFTIDAGNECMIFLCDKNGDPIFRRELYVKHDLKISRENLRKCINEFIEELKNGNK